MICTIASRFSRRGRLSRSSWHHTNIRIKWEWIVWEKRTLEQYIVSARPYITSPPESDTASLVKCNIFPSNICWSLHINETYLNICADTIGQECMEFSLIKSKGREDFGWPQASTKVSLPACACWRRCQLHDHVYMKSLFTSQSILGISLR